MPPAAIATLIFAALLVVALAVTLIWVVVLLRRITDTLGKVTFGVRAVAHRTGPLNAAVDGINADLREIADAIEGLVHQPHREQEEIDELPAEHR